MVVGKVVMRYISIMVMLMVVAALAIFAELGMRPLTERVLSRRDILKA